MKSLTSEFPLFPWKNGDGRGAAATQFTICSRPASPVFTAQSKSTYVQFVEEMTKFMVSAEAQLLGAGRPSLQTNFPPCWFSHEVPGSQGDTPSYLGSSGIWLWKRTRQTEDSGISYVKALPPAVFRRHVSLPHVPVVRSLSRS